MSTVEFIVIGRGLMGSAAARHLTNQGASVALIGPSEPQNLKTHDGVYSSHYDSGRIVRILDPLPLSCETSKASIQRFKPLEKETGIDFYSEVGFLAASNNDEYLSQVDSQAETFYPGAERLSNQNLKERFPFFNFPSDIKGILQATGAGWIDPRKQIAAQNKALELNGGVIVNELALSVEKTSTHITVKTETAAISGKKCIFATGAFANIGSTIPKQLEYGVVPHTTVRAEVTTDQLKKLKGMPCMSYRLGDEANKFLYFLPPIEYPDGRHYVKIGHALGDEMSNDEQLIKDWFKSKGDATKIPWLTDALQKLLSSVKLGEIRTEPCITTTSPTGAIYIDQFEDERMYALHSGGGYCAKSADELGFIMAEFALKNTFPSPYNKGDFQLIYK